MRVTPTLAICLAAGVATGIALARPAPGAPAPAEAVAAQPATAQPATATAELRISGFAFPDEGAVAPGTTIQVVNDDQAPHTVVADGAFATDVVQPGGTASFTAPAAAGTYQFLCSIHPSMTGRLVVQG